MKRKIILLMCGLVLLSGCAAPLVSGLVPADRESAAGLTGDLGMTVPELMKELTDLECPSVSFLRKNMDPDSDIVEYRPSDEFQVNALMDENFDKIRALSVQAYLSGEDEDLDDTLMSLSLLVMHTLDGFDSDLFSDINEKESAHKKAGDADVFETAGWNEKTAYVLITCFSPDDNEILWMCAFPSNPSFKTDDDVLRAAENAGLIPDWEQTVNQFSS